MLRQWQMKQLAVVRAKRDARVKQTMYIARLELEGLLSDAKTLHKCASTIGKLKWGLHTPISTLSTSEVGRIMKECRVVDKATSTSELQKGCCCVQ